MRATAPAADPLAAAIQGACGKDARVMEISSTGPRTMVIRLAATMDAALAAITRTPVSPRGTA